MDTTNGFGGGYIAIQMKIEDDVADEMRKNPNKLIGQWQPTPVPEDQITGKNRNKAEFLQFVRRDRCAGCGDINDAATHEGSYYLVPQWPRTGRVGILAVPLTRKLYYIESGN